MLTSSIQLGPMLNVVTTYVVEKKVASLLMLVDKLKNGEVINATCLLKS